MSTTVAQQSFCTFHLAQLYLGVDVQTVQEVIRYQPMTCVPLARHSVRGLMNLRGQIVTAIDLRESMALPPQPKDATPMNVVVRTPEGPVSLLVDKIGDVIEIEEQSSEPPPETLSPTMRRIIDTVYKLENRLLLTLNIDKLLAPSEKRPGL